MDDAISETSATEEAEAAWGTGSPRRWGAIHLESLAAGTLAGIETSL